MCIPVVIDNQVARAPNKIAIEWSEGHITYDDLNRRANFLARHLVEAGVKRGDIVALSMGRCVDMIVSMLGVLKAGAAYLPLDESSPPARKRKYLEDARATHVISNRDCPEAKDTSWRIGFTNIAELRCDSMSAFPARLSVPRPNDKAYVMFTSGSTGEAKGVVVPHRAITRLVLNTNYIQISPVDKILQLSPTSFDASTFEIWGALLNGATLVLSSNFGFDPNALKNDIAERGVTILWLTAALFHLIADRYIDAIRPIKTLLAGGDVLSPRIVNKVLDTIPAITVINGYGPTENTTFTCCHRMTQENRPPSDGVPIGTPVSGTEIFILDDSLSPVAMGDVGELYTSGRGLALGYLNGYGGGNFFNDKNLSEGLIYRTGDLVRENSSHELEFVGRRDNLVKVRGFRVSLDGLKRCLLKVRDVADALVVIRKEEVGGELLIAYIRPCEGSSLGAAEIRCELRVVLADYMVPDRIIVCKVLPLTENGKLETNLVSRRASS